MSVDASPAVTLGPAPPRTGGATSGPWRVAGALLALVVVYALLSLANDPRGTLGTDTGSKLATLVAMDHHGTFDPDIGYWAEDFDPQGDLHPLHYTNRVGDRWVNVTTLPMVIAARPLYSVGGERAILLLPMLGAALAALAARALARRIGGGDGWWAFWAVGLASPLTVYALDFWEHAPGVALVLWGVVLLYDVADERTGWRGALASGVCFGAAATMRTEALVYAVVAAATAAGVLLHRARRTGPAFDRLAGLGVAWAAGIGVCLAVNQALERTLVGGGIRTSRAAGTAGAAGADAGLRAKEALTTAVGTNRFDTPTDWFVGAAIAALVMFGAWRCTDVDRAARRLGGVALGIAGFLYLMRFADGLGFVPGVLTASPLAAAGLAVGWSARRWRPVGAVALLVVPIVWVFQYSGGANPQWGGRYLLVTSTLLAVGAAVVLAATPGRGRVAVVTLAALVTLAVIGWLSQRSHTVADAMRDLRTGPETVLVSREDHVLREGGAFLTPDQHWLTAESDRELDRAAAIAAASGAAHLEVVQFAGRPQRATLDGFSPTGRRTVALLPGLDLVVVRYDRVGLR
jgi:hypothetical protein